MHLFGLTGGIASGKSAVAARLRDRDVPVIDADLLAREAVQPGTDAILAIAKLLGDDVILADGSLDRKKVAAAVFGDDEKRKGLNAIVHPEVSRLTFKAAKKLRDEGEQIACYEAALIIENGIADMFRPLIVVSAPEDVQVARAVQRDGSTEDEARARIRAQMPLAEKTAAADFVIENHGTLQDLKKKTDEVFNAICKKLGIDETIYADE